MYPYIKETYDNMDFYNLSRRDYVEILRVIFLYFYDGNIYKDSEMIIKTPFLEGVFELEKNHSYYETDIMLLKMYRKELIDMTLYECDYDLETESGKDFYRFLNKYYIHSNNFESSLGGKTEYDLKKICDSEYEKFIFHICNNILIEEGEEDYFLDFCLDRITYKASIKSIKVFFSHFSDILCDSIVENKYIREEFIKKLNDSEDNIMIPNGDYVDGKAYYLRYLEYLESQGKIIIKDIRQIYVKEGSYGYANIKISFNKIINQFYDIHLEGLDYKINNLISYKNKEIFIGNYQISFQENSKIKNIYILLFDYFFKNRVSEVSFEKLNSYYQDNKASYNFGNNIIFSYGFCRRDIERKNELNKIYKDFLIVDFKGIYCKYLKEETFG